MYDKQTIISAFDKRGTLVQWLKNLDETLKNSTLVRIEKVETDGGFAFKFVFANGVEMLTPTVETIKSAKIEGGAQNDTFKITLTLSDGSIISSDDFKAPVHISEINVTEITAISQASDGFTVETKMFTDINGRTGINDILVYQMPIKGSESVVVGVDETGKSAKIHLNTDILNDIARALKIPASAPTSTEIVAVDNTGAQAMLTVGDGLSIENGALKSTGGGGGGISYVEFQSRSELLTWFRNNDISKIIYSFISLQGDIQPVSKWVKSFLEDTLILVYTKSSISLITQPHNDVPTISTNTVEVNFGDTGWSGGATTQIILGELTQKTNELPTITSNEMDVEAFWGSELKVGVYYV